MSVEVRSRHSFIVVLVILLLQICHSGQFVVNTHHCASLCISSFFSNLYIFLGFILVLETTSHFCKLSRYFSTDYISNNITTRKSRWDRTRDFT